MCFCRCSIIRLLAIAILPLALCSCGHQDTLKLNENLDTIPQESTNSNPNLPLSKDIIDDVSCPQISLHSSSYNSILYIGVASGTDSTEYIPVSYIQNGSQQLLGEIETADNILLNAPSPESLTRIDTDAMYSSDAKSSDIACILYNGNWDLFPLDITQTSYSLGFQPEQPEWSVYFNEQLRSKGIESPAVIEESISFCLDEAKISIVTATNLLPIEQTQSLILDTSDVDLPAKEHTAIYVMSALFVNNDVVYNLYDEYFEISNTPNNESDFEGVCYSPKDADYQFFAYVVQYDKTNNLMPYPLFCNMNGEYLIRDFKVTPNFLVCDIDGDGSIELVENINKASSAMRYTTVYRFKNGVPARSLTVINN